GSKPSHTQPSPSGSRSTRGTWSTYLRETRELQISPGPLRCPSAEISLYVRAVTLDLPGLRCLPVAAKTYKRLKRLVNGSGGIGSMKFEDYRSHDALGLAELVRNKEVTAD